MKAILLLIFVNFYSVSFSQIDQSDVSDSNFVIMTHLDEDPAFIGGYNKMTEYLYLNMQYPRVEFEKGIQGRVHCRFTVEKDGSITDVKILKGIPDCNDCNKEAVRLISNMPNWLPGKLNGEPVRSIFRMTVNFRIM